MYFKMSKKILTALAPVAAIVAFMVVPAMAQATRAQCGTVDCGTSGATSLIRGQSSNLKTQIQKSQTNTTDEGTVECTSSTFQGNLTSNNAETIEGKVTADTLSGCVFKGLNTDITTNASTAPNWTLKVQQPDANGKAVAHLTGAIRFKAQVQVVGFSVATCEFETANVQFSGKEQDDILNVEGSNQFMLVAADSSECGVVGETAGDLSGTFQIETDVASNPAAVVVHMS
jgi:hypothetical protein